MSAWEAKAFPKIKSHSRYEMKEAPDGGMAIYCQSQASASALVRKAAYDPWSEPLLRFRWKAESLPKVKDPRAKAGDDYALRIYVVFPRTAGLASSLGRFFAGQDLPHSSLTYVWSSLDLPKKAFANPYTSRVQMVPLRGAQDLGHWQDEEVDVLADYRAAFGEDPPHGPAQLALMSDSDNGASSGSAWVSYIETGAKRP